MVLFVVKKTVAVLVCVLVVLAPQVTSIRVNTRKTHRNRRSKTLAPGTKALVQIDGTIRLDNSPNYKTIGSNDTFVMYNVKVDGDVVTYKLEEGRIVGNKESGWIRHVKSASITLKGAAAVDLKYINPENVDVSVRLTGTIHGIVNSASCIFMRDDLHSEPLEVPFRYLRGSSSGVPDYSVTKATRAGTSVFEGNLALFFPMISLGSSAIHKEYVLEEVLKTSSSSVVVDFPIYVKGKGHCGTELFTTPTLTCSWSKPLRDEAGIVPSLVPTNDRGFGLEFELVSREDPEEIMDAAEEYFKAHRLPNNVETYQGEHALNYENPLEYTEAVRGVQYVNYCFREFIKSSPRSSDIKSSQHAECKLDEFCAKSGECVKRSACASDMAVDDTCPISLANWNWETDASVALLDDDEVNAIPGANETEKAGVGMEIVSPGPPNVLSGKAGIQSAAELLRLLARQGVQAGPSQGLHVHVNAFSSDAPGAKLDLKGIASVWVAWAKYQLAIDEMLSPGRPDNDWSSRLFLASGRPWEKAPPSDCRHDPSTCTAIFFMNMRKFVASHEDEVLEEPEDSRVFCNAMFALPDDEKPCDERYSHQRYFQVNLLPLTRYGTIEFRPHSATVKVERIARWVQFLTAFVEHFGKTEQGLAETSVFFDEDVEIDFSELRKAQRSASLLQLFMALEGQVDSASGQYYYQKKWEEGDAICNAEKQVLLDEAFAGEGHSMLELKREFEARKVVLGKRQPQTPIEIKVPILQDV